LPDPKVKITIFDDTSRPSRCAEGCGTDWTKPESIEQARQQIVQKFGRLATLEYVDLVKSSRPGAVKKMKSTVKGMPVPVLLANGRPRIAGEFDIRQILDVIEADLEAEL
jgi:DhnA family fructose-bisphosphate aldolase class Ia